MMVNGGAADEPEWVPQPHERPVMPGSPATPDHPLGRRIAYGLIAALVGLTGGMGNALVTANLYNLQGALGLYSDQVAWLPAAYAMTNICINMLLVKFRQQFGLRLFAQIFLGGYVAATAAHLLVHSFASAIIVRAISGMTAASLSTLGLLYMVQAFPAKWRLKAFALAISIPQLATPLARLFPSTMLEVDQWRTLYLFEFGLALLSLAAVRLLALPPSERIKVFEPLDFLTFALFGTGMALLCAVLSLGRILWWGAAPWLGYALCGAIVLIPPAVMIEHYRARPLLATRWLGSGDILRFALVSILLRCVLAEQNTGAVGLLQVAGLTNDQLHPLFALVALGMVAGMAVTFLTLDPLFLGKPILISLLMIAIGSFIDAHASNVTRPEQMFFSQTLIGFATTLFIGPAMIVGLTRALAEGPSHFVSFSAMFGITQTLGGLIGAAGIGSFQFIREKVHSLELVQNLTLTNPIVAARIQSSGAGYARVLGDPSLRGAEGSVALAQQVTRGANILAYNDTFLLVSAIAFGTMIWASFHIFRVRRDNLRRAAEAAR